MEDQELDFKAMFEEMSDKFNKFLKIQREYFALMNSVSKRAGIVATVAKNISKMSIQDQVTLLRIADQQSELAEKLYKKYSFDELEKEDESDE